MNITVGKSKIYQNLYIFPIMNIEWLLFNATSAIFSAILWREHVTFQWYGDGVRIVLDQHA